jgi:hypothetical protein
VKGEDGTRLTAGLSNKVDDKGMKEKGRKRKRYEILRNKRKNFS